VSDQNLEKTSSSKISLHPASYLSPKCARQKGIKKTMVPAQDHHLPLDKQPE
jgi:hypothetical protein